MDKKTNLLMISFHFPPIASSSGFLRCLKFAQHLNKKEFNVTVLTATEGAFEHVDKHNYRLISQPDYKLQRALALDASRHLSIQGKYFDFMTWPDKWSSWAFFGFFKGLFVVARQKTDVIWVTFPIASALVIGLLLSKLTRKPLIVDLRDPIWEEETWINTPRQRILRMLEKHILKHAKYVVFTSPGTIEKYHLRYPKLIKEKAKLILNGYDESDFSGLTPNCIKHNKKVFLHSGLIPVYERDPSAFFNAIASLKAKGVINAQQHEFRLRACGNEQQYSHTTRQLGIDDLVTFPGPLPYAEALAEMLGADALMIFQAATCNWQIPAKLFEYARAEKPILAWTDESGDTAQLLSKITNAWSVAPLTDADKIASCIQSFIQRDQWAAQTINIDAYTRKSITAQFAQLIKSTVRRN